MASSRLLLCPVVMSICASVVLGQSSSITPATVYLQGVSDQFQSTVDVYTDADAAGNHFAARGEIHIPNGLATPTMDEISTSAQCFGITCITGTFNGTGSNWGGWYFQNGVLGPTDREPELNWGAVPNAGYDLSGASSLQFWAKGANGGEVVEFFAFGIGYDPNSGAQLAPYPDSSMKATTGPIVLTTTWTQHTIPLSGLDLHYVLGGFGWVASAPLQANPQGSITFYIDNVQYVNARPTDPRFLVSYQTIKSDNPFDAVERNAAFVYDNAVALIAFVNAGDLTHARTIADAMLYAQAHDRFFTDNRLRNAYQGGNISLPPGWLPNSLADTVRMPGWYDAGRTTWFEDESQVSSNTGNIAWAMLALLTFYDATHEQQYLTAVDLLGDWVITNTSDTRGNGGFTGGYDGWENGAAAGGNGTCASNVFVNGQCKRLYKATEHNIDLYAAFSRLYKIEGLATWQQAAQEAKTFFLSMWDPTEGKFWTGTDEGGVNPSTGVIPLDIQVWSLEALGADATPYLGSLNYIEAHHKTSLGYGFKQDGGNACGDNTWFEGTAQVALAYQLFGNAAKWSSILGGIHSAQMQSGAVPATDGACLNTGFTLDDGQPWEYFPRAHVGATAWLSLAENGVNPFGADLYSGTPAIQINPSSIAFSGQDLGTMSAPISVTVTNSGTAALTLSSIAIQGANAQDFSIQSGASCSPGASISAGQSCSFNLVFNPGGTGARSATVVLSDNASGSPHNIALSGSGMDFALSVSSGSPSTVSVSQGQTASFGLSLTPEGGFDEAVSLSCLVQNSSTTNLPACSVSPATPTLDGTNAVNVMVSVNTGSSSAVARASHAWPRKSSALLWSLVFFMPGMLFGAGVPSRRFRRSIWVTRCLAIAFATGTLASCGTSTTGSTNSQPPKGTYTVTVSGAHNTLQHSVTMTLTIQ
jgi:hypothetical protein